MSCGGLRVFLTPVGASLVMAGCPGQTAGIGRPHRAPEAEIHFPSDGDELLEGDTQTLQGHVADLDNLLSDLSVRWFLGTEAWSMGAERQVCEDAVPDDVGDVGCVVALGVEDTVIRLEVVDGEGGVGDDLVTVAIIPMPEP